MQQCSNNASKNVRKSGDMRAAAVHALATRMPRSGSAAGGSGSTAAALRGAGRRDSGSWGTSPTALSQEPISTVIGISCEVRRSEPFGLDDLIDRIPGLALLCWWRLSVSVSAAMQIPLRSGEIFRGLNLEVSNVPSQNYKFPPAGWKLRARSARRENF